MSVISTAGDLGDATYALAILKHLEGGPHTLLLESSNITKIKTADDLARFDSVFSPLAKQQPYIKDCRIITSGDEVFWKSADFRLKRAFKIGETLMLAHMNHLMSQHGVASSMWSAVGNSKWLTVEPNPFSKGRVVINRTDRYLNDALNWKTVVTHYRHRLLFIGTVREWRDFVNKFGYVEYRVNKDLLQVASLIAGSELFIGNQSVAYAIAEGLKHPSIQETCLRIPDCVYYRENAQYVMNGDFTLPDVDGSGSLDVAAVKSQPLQYATHRSPPDGWFFRGRHMGNGFTGAVQRMMTIPEFSTVARSVIEDNLIEDNLVRCPRFFEGQHADVAHYAKIAAKEAERRAKQNQP